MLGVPKFYLFCWNWEREEVAEKYMRNVYGNGEVKTVVPSFVSWLRLVILAGIYEGRSKYAEQADKRRQLAAGVSMYLLWIHGKGSPGRRIPR